MKKKKKRIMIMSDGRKNSSKLQNYNLNYNRDVY